MKRSSHGRVRGSAPVLFACVMGISAVDAAAESVPDKGSGSERGVASAASPNILLVMTDDVGFAASTTFGGPVATPTLDALATEGVRYNNFHVTAQCSPTRAALLTGRNPHAVGMGEIPESGGRPAPGYTTSIPDSAAMIPRLLRDAGYRSAAFGKYHLIPKWELSAVGPYDHWPTSVGFDYFYGFEAAMTDEFTPNLIENRRVVPVPDRPDYFMEKDLADRAIHWLREGRAAAPEQPFFLYYAPLAAHAPVQAPRAWIERFRGRFDHGWDVERERILDEQKRLGVVPAETRLTPRPASVPAWDSLSAGERQIAARFMEVYAAALSYVDFQVGRIVEELRASGQYDNTLIIYLQGDNGTSPEGGVGGAFNYYDVINSWGLNADEAFLEPRDRLLANLDRLGGPESAPAIPTGWSTALNTPFSGWKSDAAHLGGQRAGMVMAWPGRMEDTEAVREQFHYVTDIAPTLYELAGVKPPEDVDGIPQQTIDGVSMAYTFKAPSAPSRRTRQYFENRASMAMYRDGWWASYRMSPGEVIDEEHDFSGDWQLYHLAEDFSQSRDVAASHPGRLKELQSLFLEEAARNQVLPIRLGVREGVKKPGMESPGHYVLYPGTERYSDWGFPNVRRRSWSLTARFHVPDGGGSGMIVNQGGRFAGWGLMLVDGIPEFVYRNGDADTDLLALRADAVLDEGHHVVRVSVADSASREDGPGPVFGRARSADFTLEIDEVVVARGRVDKAVGNAFMYQGAAIGHSTGSALTGAYSGPFAFNGTIERVEFVLAPRP